MEALAAIALAGNILQFLEVGGKIVSKAHGIKRSSDGELKENKDLRLVIKELDDCLGKLQLDNEADAGLKELITSCKDVGIELKEALRKVDGKSGGNTGRKTIWTSYYQALKSVWKEDDIRQKQKRLENLRSEIGFQLLASLRSSLTSLFSKLDSTSFSVSNAVSGISQLQASQQMDFERLRNEAKDTGNSVLEKLEDSAAASSEIQAGLAFLRDALGKLQSDSMSIPPLEKPSTKEFIETFHFRGMYDREEGIANAYAETFEWLLADTKNGNNGAYPESAHQRERQRLRSSAVDLFKKLEIEQKSYDTLLPRDTRELNPEQDLQQWLASDSGIFFIHGKPGSGKSTLMKAMMPFMAGDPEFKRKKRKKESFRERVQSLLNQWANGKTLLKACFYFYRPGSSLQRSHKGLLLSLLYQLFFQRPELVDEIFSTKLQREAIVRAREIAKTEREIWSLQELQTTFQQLQLASNVRIYLHIDGIDEMYVEGDGIAEILYEIAKNPNIKILTAGRWNGDFASTFQRYKSLELDDITNLDILVYTLGKLCKTWKSQDCSWINPSQAYYLIEDIATAAEGVFLWVKIVVKSLIDGSKNFDDAKQLMVRLKEYPKDLDKLYNHLLDDIEERYASRAALWLGIVYKAAVSGPSRGPHYETQLFQFSQSTKFDINQIDCLYKLLQSTDDANNKTRETQARQFQEQIRRQCRHFFKFRPKSYPIRNQRVEFAHRTVLDFAAQDRIQNRIKKTLGSSSNPSVFVTVARMIRNWPTFELSRLDDGCIDQEILKLGQQMAFANSSVADYGSNWRFRALIPRKTLPPANTPFQIKANSVLVIVPFLRELGASAAFICQHVASLGIETLEAKDEVLLLSMLTKMYDWYTWTLRVNELSQCLLPVLFTDDRLPRESLVFRKYLEDFAKSDPSDLCNSLKMLEGARYNDFEYLLAKGADPNTVVDCSSPVNHDQGQRSVLALINSLKRKYEGPVLEKIALLLQSYGARDFEVPRMPSAEIDGNAQSLSPGDNEPEIPNTEIHLQINAAEQQHMWSGQPTTSVYENTYDNFPFTNDFAWPESSSLSNASALSTDSTAEEYEAAINDLTTFNYPRAFDGSFASPEGDLWSVETNALSQANSFLLSSRETLHNQSVYQWQQNDDCWQSVPSMLLSPTMLEDEYQSGHT